MAKTFFSFISLLLLIAAAYLTGLGIYDANLNKSTEWGIEYSVPSSIANVIAVIFLVFLTSTSKSHSSMYKLITIILLVGGMFIEMYLVLLVEEGPAIYVTYIVIIVNFLVRIFLVLDFIQTGNFEPLYTASTTVLPATTSDVVKVVSPDLKQEFVTKWDAIRKKVRDSPEGLLGESETDAWRSVIKPSRDAGKFTVEALKEAASKLKHSDGSPVAVSSLDIRGGLRRKGGRR
jgi:hypothetical protein